MSLRFDASRVNRVWVLVADRAVARILAADWPDLENLREVDDLIHPAGSLRQSETVSDSPGRFSTHQGHPVSGESHPDYRHKHALDFAREIVEKLEYGRQQREYDRLIIIAPPLLLGVIRETLSDLLSRLVVGQLNKDLARETLPTIVDHVREVVLSGYEA